MAENDNATGVSGGAIERRRRDDVHLDDTPDRAATSTLTAALSCPTCGRRQEAGRIASFLLPYITEHPGHSTWELAQATGMTYSDVSRALAKAREWKAVEWEEEAREVGGVRYRYRVAADWQEITERGGKCPQSRGGA